MSSKIITTQSTEKPTLGYESARRVKVMRAPSLSLLGALKDLRVLADYRDLLYTLTVHRIRVRYKQSALGIFWAVLQPLSLMLIYTMVFSLFARMPSNGAPYSIFIYTSLLPWSAFATALSTATNSLVSHTNLVTKVYFPREILPLTYVLASVVDFLIASILMAALMIYYRMPLTVKVLYAVPLMIVMALFTTAVAFISAATQVRFRDVGVAIPLLLQLWMFATPVVYPLDSVPLRLRGLYELNPMVGIIENFRRVVLFGLSPDAHSLLISVLVTAVLLPLSYAYFKRVDMTIADVI